MKSELLNIDSLKNAAEEIGNGIYDANLGSGLYKKRIAKKGMGKRKGYRTILAFSHEKRLIFMYGFAKNEQDNISEQEELVYKKLARYYLEISNHQINSLIKNDELYEV